jgi:nucleotide-binding universal stress UspA family protein
VACSLARDVGARLIVQHFQPETGAHEDGADVVEEVLWKQLRALRPDNLATPVEHHLHRGMAAEQILRVAKETGSGLIVMGTAGRRGLRRVFTASIADRIRKKAACPVVTVQGATRLGHGDSAPECHERAPAVACAG